MANSDLKRIRPMKIWEILKQESDENHPLSTEQIRAKLAACGIDCDRRTIYADIELLNASGYEVLKRRSIGNEYFVVDRSFDAPEVLILMDAVQAASFITEKKTAEFIGKLAQLAGSQRGEVLKRNIVQFSTVKSKNENIYYIVNEISEAINQGVKIGFNYFDYDSTHRKAYRMDKTEPDKKRWYIVNPVATVFANDNYYLFCYDDKHGDMVQYRIDRMDDVMMLEEPIAPSKEPRGFNLAKHKRQLFEMFGGEEKEVTFNVDKSLLDVVFDKFGDQVRLCEMGGNKVSATADVQVSPTFIAWVCAFGDKLEVTAPKAVVKQVAEYVEQLNALYNGKDKKPQ